MLKFFWLSNKIKRLSVMIGILSLVIAFKAKAGEAGDPLLGNLKAWLCIKHYESDCCGGWKTNTGNGYYGGLQMDSDFMHTYGRDMIAKYGGYAFRWNARDQVIVAQRAYISGRGYYPWPVTAHICGLI